MFLAGLEFILTLVCLVAPLALMPLLAWSLCGPLLLFVGLLTLINAPFDFYSLGLTRALLRVGLEREGWWPFVLAFVDAALAVLFIIALSIAMVIGVQAFDAIAVHAGGTAVLPLDKLFGGIAMQPAAPEYWWVYALLLTTMVPSAINLMIGGFSLMRGIPWLNATLLGFMPEGRAVPAVERTWIALVLTLQMFVGFLLSIVVQIGLVVVVIGWVLPAFGAGLLDVARAVADANVPGVVGRLIFGAGG